MAAVVKDPAPRLVSPLLFILAGLCFLLPFAGVSCNTTAVKPEIASLSELGGATSAAEQRAENACLDGLNGFDLWTYTGLNLAAGSDPKVAASEPAACNNLSAAAGGTVSTTPSRASDVNVGVQPLILVAVAAMVLGLLLSLFRYAIRGLVVAVLAIGAIALLFLASTNLDSEVTTKIQHSIAASGAASAAGGIISGLDLSSFFTVSMGIGLILAMAALGVVALYNLVAQIVSLAGGGSRAAPALATGGGWPAPGPAPPQWGAPPPPPAWPPPGGYPPPPPPPPPRP